MVFNVLKFYIDVHEGAKPFNQESTVLSTNGAVKNGYSQAKSWTLT